MSNDIFNRTSEDYVLIQLTSVIKDAPYSIIINQDDLSFGRILRQSRARTDKIFAIKKELISIVLGKLKEETFRKIQKELAKVL